MGRQAAGRRRPVGHQPQHLLEVAALRSSGHSRRGSRCRPARRSGRSAPARRSATRPAGAPWRTAAPAATRSRRRPTMQTTARSRATAIAVCQRRGGRRGGGDEHGVGAPALGQARRLGLELGGSVVAKNPAPRASSTRAGQDRRRARRSPAAASSSSVSWPTSPSPMTAATSPRPTLGQPHAVQGDRGDRASTPRPRARRRPARGRRGCGARRPPRRARRSPHRRRPRARPAAAGAPSQASSTTPQACSPGRSARRGGRGPCRTCRGHPPCGPTRRPCHQIGTRAGLADERGAPDLEDGALRAGADDPEPRRHEERGSAAVGAGTSSTVIAPVETFWRSCFIEVPQDGSTPLRLASSRAPGGPREPGESRRRGHRDDSALRGADRAVAL